MQYLLVKHSHITFVAITIILFNLRFWLRFARPEKPLAGLLEVFSAHSLRSGFVTKAAVQKVPRLTQWS